MAASNAVYVNSELLNSWKEIADYLDRGVRTVQRWERDLQLPVRRPRGRRRSAVIAIRKEIDAWLSRCPQLSEQEQEHGIHSGAASGTANPVPFWEERA
jgi:hypothetical protein